MSFMQKMGPTSMLKEGSTIVDDPVLKNIEACKQISKMTASSMGPYGLCKMIINHLGKIFITHDAGTILSELEVEHPAAKLLVMASKSMQEEVGDGTNFVVTLGGELLYQAESIIRMGLHTSEVIEGYEKAGKKALEIAEKLSHTSIIDVKVVDSVIPAIRTALGSKIYGYESFLADIVARACVNSCPSNPKSFNVDNIRICKLDGDAITSSSLIHGYVVSRAVEGTIKHLKQAKVAIYSCAIDVPQTEAKGTALIETADQLLKYSRNEEEVMEEVIQGIAKTGVNCIITNTSFGDLALHYMEKAGMMAIKIPSKFELRRLSVAVGAAVNARLEPPTLESMGNCDLIDQQETSGKKIIVFKQVNDDSLLSTILIRGATHNMLDDVERAIDDGINVFRSLTREPRLVAGAGAFEMELQKELTKYAETISGLDQYAVHKFATAMEVIPRTIATVSGLNGTDTVTRLEAEHNNGNPYNGVSVEEETSINSVDRGIVDPLYLKIWGIRLATDAVTTILRVNHIIVAKQAGGPKQRPDQARDTE